MRQVRQYSPPALKKPFVGKRAIPNPQRLLGLFPGYRPIYSALLRNHDLAEDGPILHFLGVKRS